MHRAARRTRLAAVVTAATLRPLTQIVPGNQVGVLVTRGIIAGAMAAFGRTVPGTSATPVDMRSEAGRVMGEWVKTPASIRTDAVILYLHGSAFVACSPRTHRGLVSQLSAESSVPAFSCRYRRAPRHRFPSAADDALASYRWLREQGHTRIVVAGDSAGGHLAIDLALELSRRGEEPPSALVLLSPLYDPTFELSATRERIRRDPMISARRARTLVEHYTHGIDPFHERLRLAVRTSSPLPPTLVQAGGAEMLVGDAEQLTEDLEAAGGVCELQVWPDQMHVFQAMPRLIPEAGAAVRAAATFISAALGPQDPFPATTQPTTAEVRP
ncbi:alpha/beta hydrolase [Aeromicrobium sp.]|uniref:alpha/beta hydrolase n=1 Tax=Aeromicrobium sp. TaxID=1871063 RepID=UPI0030C18442